MLIDKKGKLFGKISIVDIIIVLVLIAVVAGVLIKYTGRETSSAQDSIKIVFYQDEAPAYAATAVRIGDPASDFQLGSDFGKVIDIQIRESEGFAESASGEFVMSPKEGHSAVLISVGAKGVYTENGINISGSNYYIGRTVTLRVGKAIFYARVYSIDKME